MRLRHTRSSTGRPGSAPRCVGRPTATQIRSLPSVVSHDPLHAFASDPDPVARQRGVDPGRAAAAPRIRPSSRFAVLTRHRRPRAPTPAGRAGRRRSTRSSRAPAQRRHPELLAVGLHEPHGRRRVGSAAKNCSPAAESHWSAAAPGQLRQLRRGRLVRGLTPIRILTPTYGRSPHPPPTRGQPPRWCGPRIPIQLHPLAPGTPPGTCSAENIIDSLDIPPNRGGMDYER